MNIVNSNELTHGQSFGRYVTPTLSIESGGRSSLSQPSLVFLHPSFSLFLVSCFFFRSGRNFNDDASGLINNRSNDTSRSSSDVIVVVIVFVDLSLWMKKYTLSLRTSLHYGLLCRGERLFWLLLTRLHRTNTLKAPVSHSTSLLNNNTARTRLIIT